MNRQGPQGRGDLWGVSDPLGRARRRAAGSGPVAPIGFGEFALADKRAPLVTVVVHDPAVIGAAAAQLLFTRVNGHIITM